MAQNLKSTQSLQIVLNQEELRAGINRLQKALEIVKQFNPLDAIDQHHIPNLTKTSTAVDQALMLTFGKGSQEYELYRPAQDFCRGPSNYLRPTPINEVHKWLTSSKANSIEILEVAIESLKVRLEQELPIQIDASTDVLPYISDIRLKALRQLTSSEFDFGKLIRLCEEINITYQEKCYFAMAMLTRALLDHVPPLFEKGSFQEVVNNYDGGRSFKKMMTYLEGSIRPIADMSLHTHIRRKEPLPVDQQVNNAPHIDTLLIAIISKYA